MTTDAAALADRLEKIADQPRHNDAAEIRAIAQALRQSPAAPSDGVVASWAARHGLDGDKSHEELVCAYRDAASRAQPAAGVVITDEMVNAAAEAIWKNVPAYIDAESWEKHPNKFGYIRTARAALQASGAGTGVDHVLVPRTLTPEMEEAFRIVEDGPLRTYQEAWNAYLEAAER